MPVLDELWNDDLLGEVFRNIFQHFYNEAELVEEGTAQKLMMTEKFKKDSHQQFNEMMKHMSEMELKIVTGEEEGKF